MLFGPVLAARFFYLYFPDFHSIIYIALEITQVKTGDLTAEIKVHITPEDYKAKVVEEVKKQSKQISVPGFRPGKVPFNLVKKMVGVSAVMDQVNQIVTHDLVHYIQENKLNILGEPLATELKSEEDFDIDCTKEMDFSFEVGLAPEVEIDWKKVKTPSLHEISADDAFMDKEIEQYIDRFGSVTNPEEAAKGDILYGRCFESTEDGEAVEGGFDRMVAFNPERIKLVKFFKPFFGMKLEEVKPVDLFSMAKTNKKIAELLFMEPDEVEALEGKSLSFQLKKVNRVAKAEMNEEFFGKVGAAYGWDNVEEVKDEATFRATLAEKIETELKESASYQFRNDLQKAIMEKHSFDLPEEFLKKWLLKTKDYTEEKLAEEFEGFAKSVKWSLVVEKLKEEGDVDVSDEDLKAAVRVSLERTLAQSGMDSNPEMMEQYMEYAMQNQEMVDGEYQKLLNDKIYGHLEEKLAPKAKKITATKFVEMIEKEREAAAK